MAPPRHPTPTDPETARKRARYFRAYYLAHKAEILEKNRRWGREHRDRLAALQQARRVGIVRTPAVCADCGRPVPRGPRCRPCAARWRYATDPEYRARRLATTRRWLERRAGG